MIIRTLYPDEPLPESLFVGFKKLDNDWVWVAENGGKIVGTLLGVPAHGLFLVLRIAGESDAPKTWALQILRRAFADVYVRGLTGFIAFIGTDTVSERKLFSISKRIGGVALDARILFFGGNTWLPSRIPEQAEMMEDKVAV